jgi:hypothetical protein
MLRREMRTSTCSPWHLIRRSSFCGVRLPSFHAGSVNALESMTADSGESPVSHPGAPSENEVGFRFGLCVRTAESASDKFAPNFSRSVSMQGPSDRSIRSTGKCSDGRRTSRDDDLPSALSTDAYEPATFSSVRADYPWGESNYGRVSPLRSPWNMQGLAFGPALTE